MDQLSDNPFRRIAAIVRFWTLDLWGRDWDRHRRGLLFKHLWAYLRNPPIPSAYMPDPSVAGMAADQESFSTTFRNRIESVQATASESKGVYLTYRPLGKNLRLLGTAIAENAARGRRVFIEPEGPLTERRALARRGQEWSPWIWARSKSAPTPGGPSAARSWNELFQNPPAGLDPRSTRVPVDVGRLASAEGPFSARYLEKVLGVAAATRYAFTPAEPIRAEIEGLRRAIDWPSPPRPVLGMHVRRGDAASAERGGKAPARSTRRSFALADYLEAADPICVRYGIEDIFLATESRDEIESASRLRPQYRFMFLDYDRSVFPDIRTSSRFIEDVAMEHPDRARALAVTAILDLYFFCECHAFVGAFNSEFSVLAWLLAVGSRGHLVPYRSLSEAAPTKSLNPFRALLNVKNNCPLELHHW